MSLVALFYAARGGGCSIVASVADTSRARGLLATLERALPAGRVLLRNMSTKLGLSATAGCA